MQEVLTRKEFSLPSLDLVKKGSIFSYEITDCKVDNYICHPSIKIDVAV